MHDGASAHILVSLGFRFADLTSWSALRRHTVRPDEEFALSDSGCDLHKTAVGRRDDGRASTSQGGGSDLKNTHLALGSINQMFFTDAARAHLTFSRQVCCHAGPQARASVARRSLHPDVVRPAFCRLGLLTRRCYGARLISFPLLCPGSGKRERILRSAPRKVSGTAPGPRAEELQPTWAVYRLKPSAPSPP